jgi:cell wall-associated NlpC family hydrolase
MGCAAFKPVPGTLPKSAPNTSKEVSLRDELFQFAKTTLGSPYRYGGNTRGGFDCSGLTFYIFNSQGITLPRTSSTQYQKGIKINPGKSKKGDLAFFALGNKIDHVGIITRSNQKELWIIHSTSSKGVIHQDILASPYWTKRFVGIKDVISML